MRGTMRTSADESFDATVKRESLQGRKRWQEPERAASRSSDGHPLQQQEQALHHRPNEPEGLRRGQMSSITVNGKADAGQYGSTDQSERIKLGDTLFHHGPLGLSAKTTAGHGLQPGTSVLAVHNPERHQGLTGVRVLGDLTGLSIPDLWLRRLGEQDRGRGGLYTDTRTALNSHA
ncbi:hypothetical protein ACFV19_07255 [Streptomyces griseoluteus]|uniref:hypothetical protein n=1 Tax=Streptomyces griseoluteus TaxID=29306 RepID=UPI0036BC1526